MEVNKRQTRAASLPAANVPVETQRPRTVVIDPHRPVRHQAQPTPNQLQPPDYAHINQFAQLMATQQQGLLGAWSVHPSAVTVFVEEDMVPKEEADPEATALNGNAGQANPPALSEPLIRAGDVVLASTIVANDSDTPDPVVAQIWKGPLIGARLLGGFEVNQSNTHLIAHSTQRFSPMERKSPSPPLRSTPVRSRLQCALIWIGVCWHGMCRASQRRSYQV